jgi:hypothetical protein
MSDQTQPIAGTEQPNGSSGFPWGSYVAAATGIVASLAFAIVFWLQGDIAIGWLRGGGQSQVRVGRTDFVIVKRDSVTASRPSGNREHQEASASVDAYVIFGRELVLGASAVGLLILLIVLYLAMRPKRRLCRHPKCEQLIDANRKLKNADDELRGSKSYVDGVEAELRDLKSLQAAQEAELRRSTATVATLQANYEKAAEAADAVRRELDNSRSSRFDLQERLQKAEEARTRTQAERDDAIREMQDRQSRLAETQEHILHHHKVLAEYHTITGRVFDILANVLYESRPRKPKAGANGRGFEWLHSEEARRREVVARRVWVLSNDLETDAKRLTGRIEEAIRNAVEYRYLIGDGRDVDSLWTLLCDKVGSTVGQFREEQLQRTRVPSIRFEGLQVVFLEPRAESSCELYIFFPILFDGKAQTVDTLQVLKTKKDERLPEVLFQGVQNLWAIASGASR